MNRLKRFILSSVEKLTFDNAGAPDLQQAKPVSKQPMCEHMGDADSFKDGDAGAVKSEFFNRTRYILLRKACMTLLETMIALSLLSILLVVVFGVFRELTELSRLTEISQKESFHTRYLESRLGFVFERIVNENETARKFFFYTQPPLSDISSSPSLIFTFDNGVRMNPAFSGDILGRIYVDFEGRLCLATWPLHVSEPRELMEQEVLIDGVAKIEYSFYAAPARMNDDKENGSGEWIDPAKKTPRKDTWHEEWPITYEQMPSILKMTVEFAENNDELNETKKKGNKAPGRQVFHFVLPSSKNPVYYPPGKFVS